MKYHTENVCVVRTNCSLNLKVKDMTLVSLYLKKLYIYVHTYPHHPQETSQSQKEAIFILKVPITVFQDNSQKLYTSLPPLLVNLGYKRHWHRQGKDDDWFRKSQVHSGRSHGVIKARFRGIILIYTGEINPLQTQHEHCLCHRTKSFTVLYVLLPIPESKDSTILNF